MTTKTTLKKATVEELVHIYRESAIMHRAAQLSGERGATGVSNRNARKAVAAYRELKSRGTEGQRAILPLVHDEDARVRSWAAVHALEFAPDEAVPVLEALVALPMPIGFSAEWGLKQWRSGELEFP